MESDGIIQYFNLASHLFILIGLLTSFWYIYLGLILLVTLGNYIEDKYKPTSESLNSNNSKGNQIVKYIKRSKIMTYFVITIKTVVLFGLSLMYFHGYI
jgi:hypothetical protein